MIKYILDYVNKIIVPDYVYHPFNLVKYKIGKRYYFIEQIHLNNNKVYATLISTKTGKDKFEQEITNKFSDKFDFINFDDESMNNKRHISKIISDNSCLLSDHDWFVRTNDTGFFSKPTNIKVRPDISQDFQHAMYIIDGHVKTLHDNNTWFNNNDNTITFQNASSIPASGGITIDLNTNPPNLQIIDVPPAVPAPMKDSLIILKAKKNKKPNKRISFEINMIQ